MRILLAEYHPALREMVAGHLARRGFAVDAVGRAREAHAALAGVAYDGLLLDLDLPDADGMTVLSLPCVAPAAAARPARPMSRPAKTSAPPCRSGPI